MVAKTDLKGMFTIWSKKPQLVSRTDVTKLSSDAGLQKELTEAVATKKHNKDMSHLVKCLKDAAAETVGHAQTTHSSHRYDPEIEALSRQQKYLSLQVNETKHPAKAKELQKQHNKVLLTIQKRAINVKLDSQATEVEQMKDSARINVLCSPIDETKAPAKADST